MVKYELEGKQQITKEVKRQSTSGIVYVSKDWVGKKVAIILLEDEKSVFPKILEKGSWKGIIINVKIVELLKILKCTI